MNTERMEALANYLNADEARTQALLDLEPIEAAAKINADGYDFTADEIVEFGKALASVAAQSGGEGELELDQLDDVSGGVMLITPVIGVGVVAGVAARALAKKKIW